MKRFKQHHIWGLGIIVLTLITIPGIVYAINTVTTGFQVGTTVVSIDAHGVKNCVNTTNGSTQFVATKTPAEWASFRNNTPPGITASDCPLIMTFTTIDGTHSVEIPAFGTGHNYDVDWDNDGVYDQFGNTGEVTHSYGAAGTYTVRITGDFPRMRAADVGGRPARLESVDQWGDIAWDTMFMAFSATDSLEILATDAPDLSNVTDMSWMFHGSSMNQDIGHWDTSNVTDMWRTFSASDFNQASLDNWDVSSVTNMESMFESPGTAFNHSLNSWDTSSVTNMEEMFYNNDTFNSNINSWDTSSVTNMKYMFAGSSSVYQKFNQPLNNWDVSSVTNMYGMFVRNTAFNQPLNSWDVSSVTEMIFMFDNTNYNQPLNNWNTSSVTRMSWMFYLNDDFDQNISGWNVSNVTLYDNFDTGTSSSWTSGEKPNF